MIRATAAIFAALASSAAAAQDWPACGTVDVYPDAIERGAGEATGWDAEKLAQARAVFDDSGAAALVVLHRGRVIAAWGKVDRPYLAQSVRKALLNSLVGKLVEAGDLSLDATLVDLGVDDDDPALTPGERTVTLRDLLLARSGIYHPALYEHGGWKNIRGILAAIPRDPEANPAGVWFYNNWDFNALGTIVEDAGGTPIGKQFADKIAGPIGMQDYRAKHVTYLRREHLAAKAVGDLSRHAAYIFKISTRDFARYGLLYLGCGAWGGDQVVARNWVLESVDGVETQIGWPEGRYTGFDDYGYLWWVERDVASRFPSLGDMMPYYGSSGARGHFMVVVPHLDLVVAAQPPTGGGVDLLGQMKRRIFGSPELDENDYAAIVRLFVDALPETP